MRSTPTPPMHLEGENVQIALSEPIAVNGREPVKASTFSILNPSDGPLLALANNSADGTMTD